jgi:hypothetical protein
MVQKLPAKGQSVPATQDDELELSLSERQELARHEDVIDKAVRSGFEASISLEEIRDKRLYRQTHKTFEQYLNDRWSLSKAYANRMIAAASVERDLTPMGVKISSERQARALVPVKSEDRPKVWQLAAERAGGREPSARLLEQAAAEIAPKPVPKRVVETHEMRDERAKRWKLDQEKAAKERLEAWGRDIVAMRSPKKGYAVSDVVGTDLESAISKALELDDGDVALFRAGHLVAVIIFKDGSPPVVRRTEIGGGE